MANFFKIGTFATDTHVNIRTLTCQTSGSQRYMTLEYPSGTDYVVPASKTFIITRVMWSVDTSAAAITFGYADNGVPDQAGAPTNAQKLTEEWRATQNINNFMDCFIPIPTGKYPFMRAGVGGGICYVTVSGVEV